MLEGAGLKKSDVPYQVIGNGAQAITAITTHKAATAAFPYPELLSYEAVAHITFRYFHHPILDVLRRFARAHVMAAILIRENPALAARYFLEAAQISSSTQPTTSTTWPSSHASNGCASGCA
jgi:hypothetical protein